MLAAKNVDSAPYWRSRGRERFARELAEDGIPPDEAAALLARIERDLFPPVSLDDILRDLKERESMRELS